MRRRDTLAKLPIHLCNSQNHHTLNMATGWQTGLQFAGASYSKLGNGLGPIVDANAFSSVSAGPYPRGCTV